MVKNIIGSYKKHRINLVKLESSIERLRRIRALNVNPSDIGLTFYKIKSFSIAKASAA